MDGPSGSGKSSTARGVADRLGLRYLDTGAQFRAMTVWMLRHGVDVHDVEAVAAHAAEPRIVSGTDPLEPTITLDGEDVAEEIRSADTTAAVSPVATVPAVRARLLELQRATIAAALAEGGIVVEGRDIGSVVWPDAEVKLYLTADPGARAARRAAENGSTSVRSTEEDLLRRDAIDSGRTTAPLVVPDGATHLDTTPWTLEEVVDRVVAIVESTRGAGAGTAGARTAGADAGGHRASP
ncbi:(d)CMP kinase [Nocardioides pocheonensis]|uniref:Cytidylate kinase n=1 Tax=Nocardioides pocheonensis TaxID=661485 RepID=A0A3N0GG53_9ACTN|nr:(d)CMP kinase [Nocardioides pocheonensis]RNM11186.1 (d)CMP kinase [Nocardioides pocheonensis]